MGKSVGQEAVLRPNLASKLPRQGAFCRIGVNDPALRAKTAYGLCRTPSRTVRNCGGGWVKQPYDEGVG
jgi:hypothetical protein